MAIEISNILPGVTGRVLKTGDGAELVLAPLESAFQTSSVTNPGLSHVLQEPAGWGVANGGMFSELGTESVVSDNNNTAEDDFTAYTDFKEFINGITDLKEGINENVTPAFPHVPLNSKALSPVDLLDRCIQLYPDEWTAICEKLFSYNETENISNLYENIGFKYEIVNIPYSKQHPNLLYDTQFFYTLGQYYWDYNGVDTSEQYFDNCKAVLFEEGKTNRYLSAIQLVTESNKIYTFSADVYIPTGSATVMVCIQNSKWEETILNDFKIAADVPYQHITQIIDTTEFGGPIKAIVLKVSDNSSPIYTYHWKLEEGINENPKWSVTEDEGIICKQSNNSNIYFHELYNPINLTATKTLLIEMPQIKIYAYDKNTGNEIYKFFHRLIYSKAYRAQNGNTVPKLYINFIITESDNNIVTMDNISTLQFDYKSMIY